MDNNFTLCDDAYQKRFDCSVPEVLNKVCLTLALVMIQNRISLSLVLSFSYTSR